MKARTWLVWAVTVGVVGVVQPFILTGAVIAAGGAAVLLGAATIEAAKIGVVGAGAIGAAKIGAVRPGAAKVGVVGLYAAKVGAVGLAKLHLGKVVAKKKKKFNAGLRSSHDRAISNELYIRSYGSSRHRRFKRAGRTMDKKNQLSSKWSIVTKKPCGLRLVCEMATKSYQYLDSGQKQLMNYLLNPPTNPDTMFMLYSHAARLGREKSAKDCKEEYKRSTLKADEVMQALQHHLGINLL